MTQTQAPELETIEATEGVTVHKITGNDAEIRLCNLHFLYTDQHWAYTAFYGGETVRTGIAIGKTAADALYTVIVTICAELATLPGVDNLRARVRAFHRLDDVKGLAQCQMIIGDIQAIDRGGDHIPPMVCGADLNADSSCPVQHLHTSDARLAEVPELEDSRVEGHSVVLTSNKSVNDLRLPVEVRDAMAKVQNVIIEHHHDGRTWNRSGYRNDSFVTVGEWPADVPVGQPVTVSVARGGARIRLDY
jgi:hypothetical protein